MYVCIFYLFEHAPLLWINTTCLNVLVTEHLF